MHVLIRLADISHRSPPDRAKLHWAGGTNYVICEHSIREKRRRHSSVAFTQWKEKREKVRGKGGKEKGEGMKRDNR